MESKDGEDVPYIGEDDHAVYVTRSGPLGTNAREDRLSDRTPLVDVIGHAEEELTATPTSERPSEAGSQKTPERRKTRLVRVPSSIEHTDFDKGGFRWMDERLGAEYVVECDPGSLEDELYQLEDEEARIKEQEQIRDETHEKTEFEQYKERYLERLKRIRQVYPCPEEDWSTGEDDSSNCSTPQAVRESIAEEALGSPDSPPDSMWDRPVQRQFAVTDEQVEGIRADANSFPAWVRQSIDVPEAPEDPRAYHTDDGTEPVPVERRSFVAAPTRERATERQLNPHPRMYDPRTGCYVPYVSWSQATSSSTVSDAAQPEQRQNSNESPLAGTRFATAQSLYGPLVKEAARPRMAGVSLSHIAALDELARDMAAACASTPPVTNLGQVRIEGLPRDDQANQANIRTDPPPQEEQSSGDHDDRSAASEAERPEGEQPPSAPRILISYRAREPVAQLVIPSESSEWQIRDESSSVYPFGGLPPPSILWPRPAFGTPVISATDVTSQVTLPSPPAPVEPEEADAEVPAFENDTDPRNNNKTQNIEDIIRCPVYQMAMRYPIQARCCGVHFGRAGALGVLNSRKKKCPLCNKAFEVIPGVDKVLQEAIRVEVEKHGYEYDEDELEHMNYRCPILLKIMRYPVRLECCGRVLSQYAACQHFQYHDWCPFCEKDTVIPTKISYTLKNLIDACVARGDFQHEEEEQTLSVTEILKKAKETQEDRERKRNTPYTWTPKSAKQGTLDMLFRGSENKPLTEHTGVHNRCDCVMLVLLEAAMPHQLNSDGTKRFHNPMCMDTFIAGTAHAWKHIWKRLRLRFLSLPSSHQIIVETRNGSDKDKMHAIINYVSESNYRILWDCALEGLMDAQTWWPPRGTKLYSHQQVSTEKLGREMATMFGDDCTDLGLPKDFEGNAMVKAVGAQYCRSPRENIAKALLKRNYNIGVAAAYMTHDGRAKSAEMLLECVGVKPLPNPVNPPAQELTAEFLDELTHRLCGNNALLDILESALSRRKPAKKPRRGLMPLLE